jgi:hypothetical protein
MQIAANSPALNSAFPATRWICLCFIYQLLVACWLLALLFCYMVYLGQLVFRVAAGADGGPKTKRKGRTSSSLRLTANGDGDGDDVLLLLLATGDYM